jgi:hypothetical protein
MIYDYLNSDENDFNKNFLDNEMNLEKKKEEENKQMLKKILLIENKIQ